KYQVGNSKEEHSASTETKEGNEAHAPGENKARATDSVHERPAPPAPPTPQGGSPPSAPGGQGGGARGVAAQPAGPPPSPGGAGPASPEVIAGEKGSYALDPVNPGG